MVYFQLNVETYEATELHVETRGGLSQELHHRNNNDVRAKTTHSKHASFSGTPLPHTVTTRRRRYDLRNVRLSRLTNLQLFFSLAKFNVPSFQQ